MLALLGQWWYGIRNQHDTLAMVLIAVGAGVLVFLVEFACRLFRAPVKIHKQQAKEIENMRDAARQALEARRPHLTISWKSAPPCFVQETALSRCRLEVHNTNPLVAAKNVRVELAQITPVPRSLTNPVFPVNLPPTDEKNRTINPDSRIFFDLFTLEMNPDTLERQVIIRDENESEQRFLANDTVEAIMVSAYKLVIRASALEGPTSETTFELRLGDGYGFNLAPV